MTAELASAGTDNLFDFDTHKMIIPLGNHPLHTRGLGGTFAPVKVPGVINRLTPSCPWPPDFFGCLLPLKDATARRVAGTDVDRY